MKSTKCKPLAESGEIMKRNALCISKHVTESIRNIAVFVVRISLPFHASVPMNRTLSSTGQLFVQ